MVRCHEEQLEPLDAWIASQPEPQPSRPEAIRKLLDYALGEIDPLEKKITVRKLAKDLSVSDVVFSFEQFIAALSDENFSRGEIIEKIIFATIQYKEKMKDLIDIK